KARAARDDVGSPRDFIVMKTLELVGQAYATVGRFDDARAAYAEEAALADELKAKISVLGIGMNLARLALLEHRWAEAAQQIQAPLPKIAAAEDAVGDERLKLSYSGLRRNGEQIFLEALAAQDDWAGAFAASERMRSRRLLAALGSDATVDAA